MSEETGDIGSGHSSTWHLMTANGTDIIHIHL